MRLTLRTLLAYLDEILDPQDAEHLREKIEDSEFATSLVHQIRGSVRRLRLDAPALDAQGIGGDINSIAEYLDNTLPVDQVPALEKVCLENEVHLGEVASCHQILTLVLGQAADVDENMRQRCYGIARTIDLPMQEADPPRDRRVETPLGNIPAPPPTTPEAAESSTQVTQRAAIESPGVTAPSAGAPPDPSTLPETIEKAEQLSARRLSTKEAWRKDAKAQEEEIEEQSRREAIAAPLPDYVEKHDEASWWRSTLLGALIALLIFAGLLIASGPLNENPLLRGWFGSGSEMAEAANAPSASPRSADPTGDIPLANPSSDTPAVEDTRPAMVAQPNDSMLPPVAAAESEGQPTPLPETPATEATLMGRQQPRSDALPTSNPFVPVASPDVAPEVQVDPGTTELPVVEGYELAPSEGRGERQQASSPLPSEDEPIGDVDGFVPVDPVDPPFPPAGGIASDDVLPDPIERSDERVASVPRSRAVPLPASSDVGEVDPGPGFQPVPVEPPVASPAPNVAVDGKLEVSPAEPRIPEPVTNKTLPPTTLRSANQPLLVFDRQSQFWQRADPALPLALGDQLMNLPAFRSDVEVGSDLTCTLVDASLLQLGPESDVTLVSGRMLLRMDKPRRAQAVRYANRRLVISSLESDGILAIEANFERLPGSDPQEPPHTLLTAHALKGDLSVRVGSQDYLVRQGHSLISLDDYQPRVEPATKKPKWLQLGAISDGDSSAVRRWTADLGDVDSIVIWLQERANKRGQNERALAARCLAEMGEFSAIVAALNDSQQRAYWQQHFDTLQRMMGQGSEVTERLLVELEKVHGSRATKLLELIRGYSERELAEGGAAELVKYLSHPSLDHRVLAFENLRRITGSTHYFYPEKPGVSRNPAVKRWQSKLRAGQITYRKRPAIELLLESFAEASP